MIMPFTNRWTVFALLFSSPAWAAATEQVIYNFAFNSSPSPSLVIDRQGRLYAGTSFSGASRNGQVFQFTRSSNGEWTASVIYEFPGGVGGSAPGGFVLGESGSLYGTSGGGQGCGFGCGTVFKLSVSTAGGPWQKTVLYSFTGGTDGSGPIGSLVRDSHGRIYGATTSGGGSCGCGVVFELSPDSSGQWRQRSLHTFTGGTDGAAPRGGVTFGPDGALYGTTSQGGGICTCGTVFQLMPTPRGPWIEATLHQFRGSPDGAAPAAGVTFEDGAHLFGTTYDGGGGSTCLLQPGCGTVYELTRTAIGSWSEQVIHRFRGADGLESFAAPIFDAAGNLYATTFEGGAPPCPVCGTAFRLAPLQNNQWKETILHSFGATLADAATPVGNLVMDSAGRLYGIAIDGGSQNGGAIFAITS